MVTIAYRFRCQIFKAFPFRLESEIQDLQSMDIGLMPLPDTPWTRAKCAFKAIQYMALGIPTVLTPIGMSAELVQHGENGLHATTVNEWFDALTRLVWDLPLRRRISLAGRKTIEQQYSLQRWAPGFSTLIRAVIEGESWSPTELHQSGRQANASSGAMRLCMGAQGNSTRTRISFIDGACQPRPPSYVAYSAL